MNPNSSGLVVQTDQVQQAHLQQIAGQVTQATGHVHSAFDIQPPQDTHPLDVQTQDHIGSLSEDDDSLTDSLPFFGETVGASRAASFLIKKISWLKKKYGGDVSLK